ncbi:MAG: hypothetical protein AAF587_00585 [Bacteroidota bacterium]
MNHSFSLLVACLLLTLSSCSRFVTQDRVRTRVEATPNPHQLDIYYGEEEVPYAYRISGYFEWRRVEPFTHRKNIGRKLLKKTNRYINRGNLPKPDGVIINDFLHATYIVYTGDKKIGSAPARPDAPTNKGPIVKEKDFTLSYLSPNDPSAPKLRVGAGLSSLINSWTYFNGVNVRGNYWLGNNSAVSVELTPYLPSRRIFRLHASANYQYYLNLKEQEWAPIELSIYPYAGATIGLNRLMYAIPQQDGRTGETFLLANANLGIGSEYRLTDVISAHLELGGLFFLPSQARNTQAAFALGAGLSCWLASSN